LDCIEYTPTTTPQEKKAAIAKNALACFGPGKDKDGGRLNLEDLRRFFV
jgi:hypothetical protein